MSQAIVYFCPRCNQNTLHEVYKVNGYGEKINALKLFAHGILTGGVGFLDIKTHHKCLNCGKITEL